MVAKVTRRTVTKAGKQARITSKRRSGSSGMAATSKNSRTKPRRPRPTRTVAKLSKEMRLVWLKLLDLEARLTRLLVDIPKNPSPVSKPGSDSFPWEYDGPMKEWDTIRDRSGKLWVVRSLPSPAG